MHITAEPRLYIAQGLFFVTSLSALMLAAMRSQHSLRTLYMVIALQVLAIAGCAYIGVRTRSIRERWFYIAIATLLLISVVLNTRASWSLYQTQLLLDQIGKDLLEIFKLLKPKGLDV